MRIYKPPRTWVTLARLPQPKLSHTQQAIGTRGPLYFSIFIRFVSNPLFSLIFPVYPFCISTIMILK